MASVMPPTQKERSTMANVIGTASIIWWGFILVGIIDLVLLEVDAQADPALSQTLQIPIDLLFGGLIIRILLIVYGVLATGDDKILFDTLLDPADIMLFAATVAVGLIGVILVNLVTPTLYGATVVGFGFVKVMHDKKKERKPKVFKPKDRRQKFILPVMLALVLSGSALQSVALAQTTSPYAPFHPKITLSATPNAAKLEGFLEGIAEESFFRGGILSAVITLGVAVGAPLPAAVVIGVIVDESLFTTFHGFVYGTAGIELVIVFFSGVIIASGFLFPLFLGRPTRLDAIIAVHSIYDYLTV